jgi:L-2-hydroxyglutarate oxidase
MIRGYVTVGPNAVLAMAREGDRWRDINLADLSGMVSFGGFWKMLKTYGPSGISEVRNRKRVIPRCAGSIAPSLSWETLSRIPLGFALRRCPLTVR